MIKNSVTIMRGTYFNVHTSGYARLIEKGGSIIGRSIEIPKGSRVCITDIDFYTKRLTATWQEKTVSLDYEFILRNCSQDAPTLTQTVPAIQAVEIESDELPYQYNFFNSWTFMWLLCSALIAAVFTMALILIIS